MARLDVVFAVENPVHVLESANALHVSASCNCRISGHESQFSYRLLFLTPLPLKSPLGFPHVCLPRCLCLADWAVLEQVVELPLLLHHISVHLFVSFHQHMLGRLAEPLGDLCNEYSPRLLEHRRCPVLDRLECQSLREDGLGLVDVATKDVDVVVSQSPFICKGRLEPASNRRLPQSQGCLAADSGRLAPKDSSTQLLPWLCLKLQQTSILTFTLGFEESVIQTRSGVPAFGSEGLYALSTFAKSKALVNRKVKHFMNIRI